MGELDARIGRRLRDELPGVYKRVLARSVGFAADPRVLAVFGGDAAAAAEDLVQEAVMRTLDGRRKWDPSRVELEHFLVQAVRSIADSYKHRGAQRGPTYDEELGQPVSANPIAQAPPNPSQLLEAKEADEILENELIAAAGDEDELLHLVEALLSGAHRPREVAESLDWDIEKVNVLIRKLRRRVRRQRETARQL